MESKPSLSASDQIDYACGRLPRPNREGHGLARPRGVTNKVVGFTPEIKYGLMRLGLRVMSAADRHGHGSDEHRRAQRDVRRYRRSFPCFWEYQRDAKRGTLRVYVARGILQRKD